MADLIEVRDDVMSQPIEPVMSSSPELLPYSDHARYEHARFLPDKSPDNLPSRKNVMPCLTPPALDEINKDLEYPYDKSNINLNERSPQIEPPAGILPDPRPVRFDPVSYHRQPCQDLDESHRDRQQEANEVSECLWVLCHLFSHLRYGTRKRRYASRDRRRHSREHGSERLGYFDDRLLNSRLHERLNKRAHEHLERPSYNTLGKMEHRRKNRDELASISYDCSQYWNHRLTNILQVSTELLSECRAGLSKLLRRKSAHNANASDAGA